jgi:hypothetical protein
VLPRATTGLCLNVSDVPGDADRQAHERGRPGPDPLPCWPAIKVGDRLTAATSPIAAFAGLAIGLLVLKMTRQQVNVPARATGPAAALMLATSTVTAGKFPRSEADGAADLPVRPAAHDDGRDTGPDPGLLRDASAIYQDAAARGERLSQRTLARQLRGHGHRFPNDHLHWIAECIGLAQGKAA